MPADTLSKEERKQIKQLWKDASENSNPEAMFEIGWKYQIGNGTVKDRSKSLFWCQRAADQNDKRCLCEMGYKYLVGDYVEKDIDKAIELFKEAGILADDKAIFNLATIYSEGLGVEKNESKALAYYRRAAELGNRAATGDLGIMLLQDDNEDNFNEAIKLISSAAEAGHVVSMYNMDVLYYYGIDDVLEQDTVAAKYWLKQAADYGDSEAQAFLDEWFG
ncbi:MAG: sel1 repeat family protein [Bacteroidetes bacterium]|nr:sel1 repeat family protein [Bacteroidota bacterium]